MDPTPPLAHIIEQGNRHAFKLCALRVCTRYPQVGDVFRFWHGKSKDAHVEIVGVDGIVTQIMPALVDAVVFVRWMRSDTGNGWSLRARDFEDYQRKGALEYVGSGRVDL